MNDRGQVRACSGAIISAMKVRDLGEFGLIDRLTARVAASASARQDRERLVLGIGDDAAAWRCEGGLELCTTDTMVEGVHFTLETASWADVGWKVLAVNLSDIAAMGGSPLYAVVTLGLPEDLEAAAVDALYDGMLDCAAEYGAAIVGGDVVRSPAAFVTVAMTGSTPGPLLTRAAARPGDEVAVTGKLGGSGAWLAAVRRGASLAPEAAESLRNSHLRPRPRLAEGQALREAGVRCAIDVSDGLAADLAHLCEASGVGARLDAERIPVHPAVRRTLPNEALALALGGGEEYQLLFTATPDAMAEARGRLPGGFTVIGQVVQGPPARVSVMGPGGEMLVDSAGWDHFRS